MLDEEGRTHPHSVMKLMTSVFTSAERKARVKNTCASTVFSKYPTSKAMSRK